MKYSEKVKASEKVLKAIKTLKNDEELKLTYQGKPNLFKIRAYESCGKMQYSIWQDFRGMNIASIGRTVAKAYTFDMMSQKTTYNFQLHSMEIIE